MNFILFLHSFNHKAITVSTKINNRIYYNINLAQ